jgi:hypothetical protein
MARLCGLGASPVTVLASVDIWHEVVPGKPRVSCLSMSCRVSCTNACTISLLASWFVSASMTA